MGINLQITSQAVSYNLRTVMGSGSSSHDKASEANQEQPHISNNNDKNNNNNNNAQAMMLSDEKEKEKLDDFSLPHSHKHRAISGHVHSPADGKSPTTKNLPQQIADEGVSQKVKNKEKNKEDSNRNNCFTISARDLSITWAEDERFWRWQLLKESSGNERDHHFEVAELQNVCWLEVRGRLDVGRLPPASVYRVVFVVQLKDPAYGWEVPVNVRLVSPDGKRQERKENLMEKPRGRWVEIDAGEFVASPENVAGGGGGGGGEVEFSMFEYEGGEWKKGLLIKGVLIKPK